jgi:hypothetical protein
MNRILYEIDVDVMKIFNNKKRKSSTRSEGNHFNIQNQMKLHLKRFK